MYRKTPNSPQEKCVSSRNTTIEAAHKVRRFHQLESGIDWRWICISPSYPLNGAMQRKVIYQSHRAYVWWKVIGWLKKNTFQRASIWVSGIVNEYSTHDASLLVDWCVPSGKGNLFCQYVEYESRKLRSMKQHPPTMILCRYTRKYRCLLSYVQWTDDWDTVSISHTCIISVLLFINGYK